MPGDRDRDVRERGEIAERLERDAVRNDNRGDTRGALEARDAAERARNAGDAREARRIEVEYNRGNPRPDRESGRRPGGRDPS